MRAKPAYRDRDDTDVEILDALAERKEDGMTVFELRAEVETDIDTLEGSLADLKDDDLIEVDEEGERMVILPQDHVVGPESTDDEETDVFDQIRDRLPF
jgi:DNA-binding transcriptional ArsR family regulator